MLSIFAFSMVAVGMSASASMSHNPVSSGLGVILAVFFTAVVLTFGIIRIVLGFRSMFVKGINYESSVSLWIVIPILTLVAITIYRVSMGLSHNFEVGIHPLVSRDCFHDVHCNPGLFRASRQRRHKTARLFQ